MSIKSSALTTVQRASDYAGLGTLSGTNLSVMERLINSSTDFIENYTGKSFKQAVYTSELYTTENSNTINLNNFPVSTTATFKLERRTSGVNEDSWSEVDSKYYHIDYANGIIIGASGLRFNRTNQGYRVTYTAGYDYDNSTTFLSDTDAGDIELAMWMLLEGIWNKRKGGFGIDSEKIGDYSVKYRKEMMENDDLKAILDKYADVGLGNVITPIQI